MKGLLPCLVGSLGGSFAGRRDFYPALTALVRPVQFFFSPHTLFQLNWAAYHAGPPVSQCVSPVITIVLYTRDGIFKPLRSTGIDSRESIPPAYVAWRAGTTTLLLLGS
jgi:hypothetical protein